MPHTLLTKEKLVVVKHNDLIDAAQQLSVIESRIILTCISRINSKEILDPSVKFVLSVEDIKDLIGVSGKSSYENLKEAATRLYMREVILLKPSKRVTERRIRWVSEISYIPSEGVIELFFTPSISKLLSDIQRDFTQYKLENVLGFKSSYSIRFYELFKRWGGGDKVISLEDLQDLLELQGKYPRWNNFRQWVLVPVIEDINATSDVKVTWEPVFRGRKVVAISFAYALPKKEESPKLKKSSISLTTEGKVDNLQHYADMRKRFGNALPVGAIPVEIIEQLKAQGRW